MKMKEIKEAARKLGVRGLGETEKISERKGESFFFVGVCVSSGKRTSKSLQSKRLLCFFCSFFFFLTPRKLLSTLPSDYSSVSAQRRQGLLDTLGHR